MKCDLCGDETEYRRPRVLARHLCDCHASHGFRIHQEDPARPGYVAECPCMFKYFPARTYSLWEQWSMCVDALGAHVDVTCQDGIVAHILEYKLGV